MDPNHEVFNRAADFYDAYRPSPPAALPGLLTRLARVDVPTRVVDLGAGTGLSTFLWAGQAQAVTGVEPNSDMLAVARQKTGATPSITFQPGSGSATGLPDGCADIVTCAQAFHWMEPEGTLAEIARILRPGGVFAAYDYLWPPTFDGQAEAAYET
ncbi:MAG TPA: class I SAM-dependent methyltransferase, partial [Anaerolineaceae bacterium]|nr:class I SAM-dependent methyltransferase [Anaerolineaceae bacterium]